MLHIKGTDISLTRGDTAYIEVKVTTVDDEGKTQPYVVSETDTLVLSIKRRVKDAEPCVQKTITGSTIFHILPEDTCDCEFAKYLYDVQLTTEDGDVYTVIEPALFEILQEVTC